MDARGRRLALLVLAVHAVLLSGCLIFESHDVETVAGPSPSAVKTFHTASGPVETIGGKPVIRLFVTTWCPHSNYIVDTYYRVAKEYADAGKIVACLWEVDTGDDLMTPAPERVLPPSEQAVFDRFNPVNSIPTFVFGGKYYRVGNAYEHQSNGLQLEEAEFRAVIEELI
jgi:thiol-disulfide isomerase/thioredoxin